MLRDFHVRSYRGYQDFRLNDLGQVNVLVGRNNAGKSSLLEALYLYATRFEYDVIQNISMHRGETTFDYRQR